MLLFILAHKQDLFSAVDPEIIAIALKFDKTNHVLFTLFPCSSKTGDQVVEGMSWLQKRIIKSNK